ncbi:Pre-mrna-splicing factor clf1 [Thalictrum thalictroides]|uniref:Pre-mrna-splicing factor clf1 n=1 Tax=Thalictrum thalictroides TaxID=46969 RepID=A0A7J6X6J5_THATH|nr:Pre-mrna-splicing factor clf1 [Thalictrum thalictroides]
MASGRVKIKNPSPIQISAEQLIRDARETTTKPPPPKQKILYQTEIENYRLRKRKQFEGKGVSVQYAQWEEAQKDFDRARSIWERLVQGNYKNPTLWLKYTEFEMKNKFIMNAKNVFHRAIALLPHLDQLWFKYIQMLEMLGNVDDARQVYEHWMIIRPHQHSLLAYIKFELRYNEIKRAEQIYKELVQLYPQAGSWIQYTRFLKKYGNVDMARKCFECALERVCTDDKGVEILFIEFAEFEEESKEIERARGVYKFALNYIPRAQAENLCKKFVEFEKRHGNKEVIEDSIVGEKRSQYEIEVRKNPLDYNTWFDYILLEENTGKRVKITEIYERAITNIPPTEEKQYWKRYIYLWIKYALHEEVVAEDIERTRDVYNRCLKLIPHHKFSFAKIWLLAAQFEIRQQNLEGARKILGNSIDKAPKGKIFQKYIEIELHLGNVNRCRTLYEKYLEWAPQNIHTWIKFAQLEKSLSETQRARAIFELAVAQPALDMPELLWKEYIDFEISEREYDRARQLYARLLYRTKHLNVWISYANFEATAGVDMLGDQVSLASRLEQKKQCIQHARNVFETAVNYFRTSVPEQKEERAMLLKEWLNMESSFGNLGDISLVQDNMPKKLKQRREAVSKDGCTGYEECHDYYFPEETTDPNLKILEAAYMWKRQRLDQSNG